MSDIRVGIVGAGANTTSRHIPLLQAIDGVEIVGLVNRSEESSLSVSHRFGIPKTYDCWEQAVADSDTNAIVIGTWPYLHCPVTLAALDAGKHVLNTADVTVPANVFAAGIAVTIINGSSSDINITQGTSTTIYNTADGTTGSRVLAKRGIATVLFVNATDCYISGAGLS